MSGPDVRRALRQRFDAIRRTEVERLEKKLRGLTAVERQSLEGIVGDIVGAIATVPPAALGDDTPDETIQAVVQLFALDSEARAD